MLIIPEQLKIYIEIANTPQDELHHQLKEVL
jgi:hypothetical protein